MPNMTLTKVPMPAQEPDVRNKNFEEVALGYTEEMAMEEATRCINCKNKMCIRDRINAIRATGYEIIIGHSEEKRKEAKRIVADYKEYEMQENKK